jgi:hypothetical protein
MYYRITSDAFLANVSILQRNLGIADSDIAAKLGASNVRAGKIGAVIIVMMPFADCPLNDGAGPQLDILPIVRIITQPQVNLGAGGTGLTAEVIAFRSIRLFHFWKCDLAGATLYCDPRVMRPAPVKDMTKLVAYDMYFRARTALQAAGIVAPKITVTDGLAQITCNTAGVAIWSTMDGSYPIPGVGTSTLYTVPFVASNVLIRAGAYKADCIPSGISRQWAPLEPLMQGEGGGDVLNEAGGPILAE